MKNKTIAVIGLNHLGMVTTACMASLGYQIKAIDFDTKLIENYKSKKLFLNEPGVASLLEQHQDTISFSSEDKLEDCDYIWVTIDMPLDEEGGPDYLKFESYEDVIVSMLPEKSKVIVSSQLKMGKTKKLHEKIVKAGKTTKICYSPENLRLGKSVDIFKNPDRIVIGCDSENIEDFLPLFESISNNLLWMKIEEAELSKHAINSFLATCIVFINQLSNICEKHNISSKKVSEALKSESRIGANLPLLAGLPFAGGTLPRDLYYLDEHNEYENLFKDLLFYNERHRLWLMKNVLNYFGTFNKICDSKFLIVGLSYKEGINDSRFSEASKFIDNLKRYTSQITTYDEKFDQNFDLDELDFDCVCVFNKSEKIFEALQKTNKQIFVLDPNNLCVGDYPSNIIFKKVGEPSSV